MAPIYDYSCRLGHTTEARRGYDDIKIVCPLCGDSAWRLAVYQSQYTITETGGKSVPRLNNAKSATGKYRVSDFIEASSEIAHEAEKAEKREGQPVKVPDFYRAGLRKAEKMGARRR